MTQESSNASAQDNKVGQLNDNLIQLDTKVDRLDSKVDRIAAELKALIEQSKSELIRWFVGMAIATISVMSTLKLFH